MLAVILGIQLLARDTNLIEVFLQRRNDSVNELLGNLVVVCCTDLEEDEIDEDDTQGKRLDLPVVDGESLEKGKLAEFLRRKVL